MELKRSDFDNMVKKMEEQNVKTNDRFIPMGINEYKKYVKNPKKYMNDIWLSIFRKRK